jgi:hypothetical protein
MDQNAAGPPRRRPVAGWFGKQQRGVADHHRLSTNKSSAASAKANRGDNNNALPIFRRLRPVHARGARTAAQKPVSDANAHDRSDQGVRARGLVTAFRANTASRPEGKLGGSFYKKAGSRVLAPDLPARWRSP